MAVRGRRKKNSVEALSKKERLVKDEPVARLDVSCKGVIHVGGDLYAIDSGKRTALGGR
jgi:hypothetical protein